jgi:hypothetical protein
VAIKGMDIAFYGARKSDVKEHIRCPSAYGIGAHMLPHIDVHLEIKVTFLLLKFS